MEPVNLPDTTILKKAGLTESQAKGYLALIEYGELSPADLAEKTGETRTNGYMICEKLESLGLATKKDDKKVVYLATHPSNLEVLAEKRRKVLVRNEQEVKNGLSPLIDMFYKFREEPGARTLQGIDGIKEVYTDILKTGKTVYLLRTPADIADLGEEFINEQRAKRVSDGIVTKALTPLTLHAQRAVKSGNDEKMLFERTFLPDNTYASPVEMQIYGDKCAFIAYGETQMATVIHSPLIAEAMRQIFTLLAESLKEYSDGVKRDLLALEPQS